VLADGMPKKLRLTGAEIRALVPKKRLNSGLFSLLWAPSSAPKVSVVVSKKVAKTAVARNRMKRRTREALRSLHLHNGAHLIIAKSPALSADMATLRDDLTALLSKIAH
jgi:ribonuclease P protein component